VTSELKDDPTFQGYHVSANWTLTGENRPYDKKRGIFKIRYRQEVLMKGV